MSGFILSTLEQLDGFVAAALVDAEAGTAILGSGEDHFDIPRAAAGNSEVMLAKRLVLSKLALEDGIEDILITLGRAYHLIRPFREHDTLFAYLVLDREAGNLALARHALRQFELDFDLD